MDFGDMVKGPNVNRIQEFYSGSKNVASDVGSAAKKVFGSLGDITKLGFNRTARNQTATTTIAGLGALVSGVFSIKNIFTTIKAFFDPKSSENNPWLIHALSAILEGGLAVGLAAPFTGMRSPFTQIINGRSIVPIKTIFGALAGIVGLKLYKDAADGVGVLGRIPIIGSQIKSISRDVNGALRQVSTNASPDQQQQGGGLNPAQLAQAA